MITKIKSFCFTQTGYLTCKENKIYYTSYNEVKEVKDIPKVYLWLTINNSTKECKIIYVGKTQFTIQKRMSQHIQGFKGKMNHGSVSGSKKFIHLIQEFQKGNNIEIWSRNSEIREIIIEGKHQKKISHYSTEEEFFIKEFNPDLNGKNYEKTPHSSNSQF
jgi:hypothetical protein